jgi:hypothetical protein
MTPSVKIYKMLSANKLNLIVGFAIGLLVIGSVAAEGLAAKRGPRVKTRLEVFDFGVTPQFSEVSHVFWLRNTGDETLVIDDVIPNCSCTEAPIEKKNVEPGDSTRIELIFGSTTYDGPVSKFAQVKCNGKGRVPALTFIANVIPDSERIGPIVAEPRRINLNDDESRSNVGENLATAITLTNTGKEPVNITMIDKPDRDIIVDDFTGTLAPGEARTLNVRFTEALPELTFSRSITFAVSDSTEARLTVPVFKKRSWSEAGDDGQSARAGR